MNEEVNRCERNLSMQHGNRVGELERILKKHKDDILALEQNMVYLSNEKDMLNRQLGEANKERDEWRSKF